MNWLIDTNVLVRIADSTCEQHLTAVEAVAKLVLGNDEFYVAPQVLAEFWVVASRPVNVNGLGWPLGAVDFTVSDFLKKFRLLSESPQLFTEWRRLVVSHQIVGKQSHDARLAAIMNLHGLTRVLTFNVNNFRTYPLTVLSPDDIMAT